MPTYLLQWGGNEMGGDLWMQNLRPLGGTGCTGARKTLPGDPMDYGAFIDLNVVLVGC